MIQGSEWKELLAKCKHYKCGLLMHMDNRQLKVSFTFCSTAGALFQRKNIITPLFLGMKQMGPTFKGLAILFSKLPLSYYPREKEASETLPALQFCSHFILPMSTFFVTMET